MTNNATILYDGDCLFCSRSAQLIARRDPAGHFLFSPQSSPAGQLMLAQAHLPPKPSTMVVLGPNGSVFLRSDAMIYIVARMGFPYRLCAAAARFIPRPIRDAGYALLARNRHRLLRRNATCPRPTPEFLARVRQ